MAIAKKLNLENYDFEIDKTYEPKPLPNNNAVLRGFASKKAIEKIKKLPRVISIFNDSQPPDSEKEKLFSPITCFGPKERIFKL